MSGGSFNYLFCSDADAIMDKWDELDCMRDLLKTIPNAEKAAADTETIIAAIETFRESIAAMILSISPVWKAVEWECSGDAGPENTQKVLEEYNQR